jgi:hypothetical protein
MFGVRLMCNESSSENTAYMRIPEGVIIVEMNPNSTISSLMPMGVRPICTHIKVKRKAQLANKGSQNRGEHD